MGKQEFKGGGIGNERLAHRGEKGWDNPRDERAPAPRDPQMDRYAVGTNAKPDQR